MAQLASGRSRLPTADNQSIRDMIQSDVDRAVHLDIGRLAFDHQPWDVDVGRAF